MQASEDGKTVTGYAAVFNSRSEEMWGFVEEIDPRAFDGADMSDVRALFNHDPNMLLARTSSGTLQLSVDERGLKYEFTLPDTTAGRDLAEMLRRGDVTQSSFGFTIADDEWDEPEGKMPVRRITAVKRLFDVSPVTYPAYTEASVALRSYEAWKEERQEEKPKEEGPVIGYDVTKLYSIYTGATPADMKRWNPEYTDDTKVPTPIKK